MVEFLSGAILSGVVYDMVKNYVNMTVENVQQRLNTWAIDTVTAQKLVDKIKDIPAIEAHSEFALAEKFEQDASFIELLKTIKPAQSMKQVHITQTNIHGDNIGRDKIVNSASEK